MATTSKMTVNGQEYNIMDAEARNRIATVEEDLNGVHSAITGLSGDITGLQTETEEIDSDVFDLRSALSEQPVDILKIDNIFVSEERYGVTPTYNAVTGEYTLNGSSASSGTIFWNVINERDIPNNSIKNGRDYVLSYESNNGNFFVEWVQMKNGTWVTSGVTTTAKTKITIGEDIDQLIVRLRAGNNHAYSDAVMKISLYDANRYTAYQLAAFSLPDEYDFNNLLEPGIYFADTSRTYYHSPFKTDDGGFIYVASLGGNNPIKTHLAISFRRSEMYKRSLLFGTWFAWQNVSSMSLASTGDETDRTTEIQFMLNTVGYCRLEPGYFYTTGIDIPNNCTLEGSGNKTMLVLADSVTNGATVRLRNFACVKGLKIEGSLTEITRPSAVGTRHGILFEGTADASENPLTYYRSTIENCNIRWFTGGGITLRNTGYDPASNLVISDCFIYGCGAGINIEYFSEFNRITNVTAQYCLYGCIDNGGNNNFANCDFSSNTVGLLIDNSEDQSPNNTHGSFVGCTFNHSGGNTGTAIRILKGTAGEIFTASQIFFGGIEIDECVGVRFIGANFGRNTPITVTDSSTIIFSDCTFREATDSPLTQSGNTRLAFEGCYLRNGEQFNPLE